MSRRHQSILNVLSPSFSNVYSFEFDGVDEYINADLDGTSTGGVLAAADSDVEVGVSLWFKLNTSASNTGVGIFTWGTQNDPTDGTPFMYLKQRAGFRIQTYVDGATSNTLFLNSGQWYNYILTRSASDNTWRSYIDGVEFATRDDGGAISHRSTSAKEIFLGSGYSGYAGCNIDEFAVWNTHLNTSAVTEIYNSGVPNNLNTLSNASAPVAWFRMGENATFSNPGGVGDWTLTNQGTGSNNATSNNIEEADRKENVPT